ncbi:MAG: LysM peptidoglycan-binding domain-containing protein [Chloroflexi bacterium]|nr:LysM peptidoglycan-binding domain-containing protein [Chloroflexota bacterium]
MNRKPLVVVALIVSAMLLSACRQAASVAPPATQGDAGAQSQLEAILNAAGTQTAQAGGLGPEQGGGANETAEVGTGTPGASGGLATATPTPKPTEEPLELTVPDKYTLQKGEFPYCIARRFNINAAELLNANGLSPNGVFQPGLTLTIPKNAAQFDGERSLAAHPTDYTVQSGDTFYSIACKFGDVWPEEIATANNTKVTAELNAGEVIKIP